MVIDLLGIILAKLLHKKHPLLKMEIKKVFMFSGPLEIVAQQAGKTTDARSAQPFDRPGKHQHVGHRIWPAAVVPKKQNSY